MSERQSEILFLAEECEDGGFVASAVGYAIVVGAATVEELRRRVRCSVLKHFNKESHPQFVRLSFVKEELIPLS